MSAFVLKLIAMSTMLIDHIGVQFFDNNLMMRNIGRIAFITYAFLMAEAYYHLRKDPGKSGRQILKLIGLSIVTEIPHDLFDFGVPVNFQVQSVLPTLTLGFTALTLSGLWIKRWKRKSIALCGCVVICLGAAFTARAIHSEYRFAGVMLIVLFYLYLRYADRIPLPARIPALLVVCCAYLGIYSWGRSGFGGLHATITAAYGMIGFWPGMIFAFLPLAFYNRKLGYYKKWFNVFYHFFYPLQFIVLVIVRDFII